MTREEVVSMLKRNSTGFSRGRSNFRGVTRASSYTECFIALFQLHTVCQPPKHSG